MRFPIRVPLAARAPARRHALEIGPILAFLFKETVVDRSYP